MVVESNERILKSVLTLFKCFLFFCGFDFLYVLLNEFQMPFLSVIIAKLDQCFILAFLN